MNISQTTREILKGLSRYQGISAQFYSGTSHNFIFKGSQVAIYFETEESFPKSFTTTNLKNLINILDINKKGNIEFTDNELIINEGRHLIVFPIEPNDNEFRYPRETKPSGPETLISTETYNKIMRIAKANKPKEERTKGPFISSNETYINLHSVNGSIYSYTSYQRGQQSAEQRTYIGKGDLENEVKFAADLFKPIKGDYIITPGDLIKIRSMDYRMSTYICNQNYGKA